MRSLREKTSNLPVGHATPKAALPTIHHWVRRLLAWRLRRQASRRLMAMSDAHLKDIGLHRSEVDSRLIELEDRRRHRQPSSAARRDG